MINLIKKIQLGIDSYILIYANKLDIKLIN